MNEKLVLILIGAYIVLGRALKCPNELTTVVESQPLEDYSKLVKLNDTHIRVCLCHVKPCIKKCCGREQAIVDGDCKNTPVEPMSMLPWKNLSNFYFLYGNGCSEKHNVRFYPENYSNVKYHLQMNGSLSVFFDRDERLIGDFCMENVYQTPSKIGGLLICIPEDASSGTYEFPLGMALSLPFLVATLIVYSFRELQNLHGKNLSSYVACLIVAYLSVILVELLKLNLSESSCIVLGLIRQFSFLASFFWLNVMCFDLWWSLSSWSGFKAHPKAERKKYWVYSACAWGCPAVIIFVTVAMQLSRTPESIKPGIGFPSCFLRDGRPFYAYFYGPVIFIFCTDVTLFILSAVRFFTARKKMRMATIHEKICIQGTKARYFLTLKIFIIMGVNWIIDPFSWILESSIWTWIFIQLSIALQGAYIFFVFVWKTDIKHLIISKFCANSYSELPTISLRHTSVRNDVIRQPSDTTVC